MLVNSVRVHSYFFISVPFKFDVQQPSFVISFPLRPLKNWKKNIGTVGKCEKCIPKF